MRTHLPSPVSLTAPEPAPKQPLLNRQMILDAPVAQSSASGGIRVSQPGFGLATSKITKPTNFLARTLTRGPLDTALTWLEKQPRGIELVVEDVIGFAILKSVMDTLRGAFYGNEELSWAAGRERLLRETISILTDLFIPGVAALFIGRVMDSANGGYASRFSSLSNVVVLKDVVDTLPPKATYQELGKALGQTLANSQQQPHQAKALGELLQRPIQQVIPNFEQWLQESIPDAAERKKLAHALEVAWQSEGHVPTGQKRMEALLRFRKASAPNQQAKALFNSLINHQTTALANQLGLKHLDINVNKRSTDLKSLISEFYHVLDELPAKPGGVIPYEKTFSTKALSKYLKNTLKNRQYQFIGLLGGVVTTAIAPSLINWMTRRLDKKQDYPAIRGLFHKGSHTKPADEKSLLNKIGQTAKKRLENIAPYVTNQLESVNVTPLLGALVPLAVAIGAFDTVNRRFRWPFGKNWKFLHDFGKAFPYVGQQQIACLYAILIAARLFSSRVDHEYYERVIDGITGWGIWILGTPFLKQLFAMGSAVFTGDKQQNNPLIKRVGPFGRRTLRSAEDIALLAESQLPKGVTKAKLIERVKIAGRAALITNIVLLGIIEPLVSIFVTRWRSQRQQEASWKELYGKILPLENLSTTARSAFG